MRANPPHVEFTGFTPAALRLLAGLARNNNREWFAPRKERIGIELIEPMIALVDDASVALTKAKAGLRGDRKQSVFRIYRDVRFARDKSPYRKTMAAYLSYDGGRHTQGGIYISIGPKESQLEFVFRQVPPPMLLRWRREMADRPARFERVIAQLAKRGLAIEHPDKRDDSLARMPRGFETLAQSELAPYFRLRTFVGYRDLTVEEVTSGKLIDAIVLFARDIKPLLDFGWSLD